MRLQNNSKLSSGKRKRRLDIKLFYITDLISRDEVEVRYCPTNEMIGDYMSNASVKVKFQKFQDLVMNLSNIYHHIGQQECVGGDNTRENTTVDKIEKAVKFKI